MAMVLLSPQTSCQNELGEIGGPSGEETRLRSSSSVLTADLDTYCQPFLSAWEMVKRLSEESALLLSPFCVPRSRVGVVWVCAVTVTIRAHFH